MRQFFFVLAQALLAGGEPVANFIVGTAQIAKGDQRTGVQVLA